MDEVKNAVVEVAKTTSQGVLNRLLDDVEVFFPSIKQRKIDNLLKISKKTSKKLNDRHVPLEQCREFASKGGFVYLPVAAVETDPTLQDMLAELLAKALDPKDLEKVKIAFIDVIKSMDPLDAKIMKLCHENPCPENMRYQIDPFIQLLNIGEYRFRVALDNLKRLSLIQTAQINSFIMAGNAPILADDNKTFALTVFGKAFLDCCF